MYVDHVRAFRSSSSTCRSAVTFNLRVRIERRTFTAGLDVSLLLAGPSGVERIPSSPFPFPVPPSGCARMYRLPSRRETRCCSPAPADPIAGKGVSKRSLDASLAHTKLKKPVREIHRRPLLGTHTTAPGRGRVWVSGLFGGKPGSVPYVLGVRLHALAVLHSIIFPGREQQRGRKLFFVPADLLAVHRRGKFVWKQPAVPLVVK